jgi:hypothetical protein
VNGRPSCPYIWAIFCRPASLGWKSSRGFSNATPNFTPSTLRALHCERRPPHPSTHDHKPSNFPSKSSLLDSATSETHSRSDFDLPQALPLPSREKSTIWRIRTPRPPQSGVWQGHGNMAAPKPPQTARRGLPRPCSPCAFVQWAPQGTIATPYTADEESQHGRWIAIRPRCGGRR